MNYRHTFETAMASLNEIMNLLHGMREHDRVTAIEIDLALQKTRDLYEVLLSLNQPESKPSLPGRSHKAEEQHAGPSRIPAVSGENGSSTDEIFEITSEAPAGTIPPVKKQAEKKEEKKILSDALKGKAVLGESLHQNIQYQDLSAHMHAKPVTDLAKAIGINEKYLYIRELFANDARKFEEVIKIINQARNFNEAFNYMSREFGWDMDSDIVQSLLEVVRRKFITGQHE